MSSLYHLGICYENGLGVSRNMMKVCLYKNAYLGHHLLKSYLCVSTTYFLKRKGCPEICIVQQMNL